MKKWPWRTMLAILGGCLVIAGSYPFTYCLWLANAPRPEMLLFKFPSKQGQYQSPPMKAGFYGPCVIDLEWQRSIPGDKPVELDLDWKILDDRNRLVEQGTSHSEVTSDTIGLAARTSGYRRGQRVVLTLPHDMQDLGEFMQVRARVDTSEISLDLSYAWGISVFIAGVVAGPGALLLLVLWIKRPGRRPSSGPPSIAPPSHQ